MVCFVISGGSSLKLKPARAKKSELAWLVSVTNKNLIQAPLGLEGNGISEFSLALARKEVGFPS